MNIYWEIIKTLLLIGGTSVFWILKRDMEMRMVSYIIFNFIDKTKSSDSVKVLLITKIVKSLKDRKYDITKYYKEYIKRY